MALIHTTPRSANSETVLKILDELGAEISLKNGKILISQFSQFCPVCMKLSLYVADQIFPVIGMRNVFMEDIADSVEIRYANNTEAAMAIEMLRSTRDWHKALPDSHRKVYPTADLIEAAKDVRDYLLVGKLPHFELSPALERLMTKTIPEKGIVEFDIIPTLVDIGFDI